MRPFLLLLAGITLTIGLFFAAAPATERSITLRAISGLQYDIVRFAVRPGQPIAFTLDNTDEMAHNWLLTAPGQREQVVTLAMNLGNDGPARGYVPESDLVLASIPVLDPDEQQTIRFTAPTEPGAYPYVCTYPGHGFIMYGVMYVNDTGEMPPRETDENIPEKRRSDQVALTGSGHPWPVRLPMVYRTFLPDCGPAGIAVGMENGVSYAWDAGTYRLRYAWRGGFLDMSEHWAGKGAELAEPIGEIFYQTGPDFPIRTGAPTAIPTAEFRGYSLVDGYPTLRYTLDGVAVAERILPYGETGLQRQFSIEGVTTPVWVLRYNPSGVPVSIDRGKRAGNFQHLTAAEAMSFTLIVESDQSTSR